MKIEIFALSVPELENLFAKNSIPKFRARQVHHWIYKKGIFDFDKMHNLGRSVVHTLKAQFSLLPQDLKCLKLLTSTDGKTSKALLQFHDGNICESVLMRHNYGNSVCVSSQIGCAMACKFCASGLQGFRRNLSTAEMLAQVMYFSALLTQEKQRISHVVIMGSGEPLLNYDNVISFINLLHNQNILNISYRNITLSTAGIVPNITKLLSERLPINLAISLHAADDHKRSKIMPINETYNLSQLLGATRQYAVSSKRQITYEYVLIKDFNDSMEDAQKLSALLKGHVACVNLIPVNKVQEHGRIQATPESINLFYEYLQKNGTPATIRKEMGADINAACGQLRNEYLQNRE